MIMTATAPEARFDSNLRSIVGVEVAAITRADAIATILSSTHNKTHLKIGFCNAHVVNTACENPVFHEALGAFTLLADGIGVDIASQLLYRKPFPANLNGTDFIPALLEAAEQPMRVCLLGARPGIAESAAAGLSKAFPRHEMIALGDGFFSLEQEKYILAQLLAQPADILLIAMGNPRQEIWIAQNVDVQHAHTVFGVGALFDFLAGEVSRAPQWVRNLRLEWCYRLAQEPSRLWKRYVYGNPVFLYRVLKWKLRQGSTH